MAVLTVLSADSLPPRVAVEFDAGELDALTVEVEVLASTAAGSRRVRVDADSWRVPAVGGAYVVDHEVELGVTVTYQARQFDASGGELGLTLGDSTQVDIPAGQVIVQDPLNPRSWVSVTAEASLADSLSVSRSKSMYRRGPLTVALMGELGLLEGVRLSFDVPSLIDAARLELVLSEGYFIVRSMPTVPLPRVFHCVVASLKHIPEGARFGDEDSLWDLSADEVSPSLLPILVSPLTWARYKAAYATWADAEAVYATWLDAKRNPPPEV